jgi:hypothetical protein
LLFEDARALADRVAEQYDAAGPPADARRGPRAAAGKTLPDLSAIRLYQ